MSVLSFLQLGSNLSPSGNIFPCFRFLFLIFFYYFSGSTDVENMSGLDSFSGNVSMKLTPEGNVEDRGKWSTDSKKTKRQRLDVSEKSSPSGKMVTRSAKVSSY